MANLKFSAVNISQRGSKSDVLLNGADRVVVNFKNPIQCLFAPSTFERDLDAARQSLPMSLTEEVADYFKDLDQKCIDLVQKDSERILGKQLTNEQVEAAYVSCVKTTPKGTMVKLKINIPNSQRTCRFWNKDGSAGEWPSDWHGAELRCQVLCNHLWIMGTGTRAEFGLVCLLTDAMVEERSYAFPFAEPDSMLE